MNATHGRPDGDSGPGRAGRGLAITATAYVVLFLLGLLEGLVGSFQYSRGPSVLVAILFALAILVTCMLGARGMRAAPGGVLPAVGWCLVALVLSSGTSSGSVVVTNTAQGKWFLFGGAACAAAGAVYAYVQWSRPARERRERLAARAQGRRPARIGKPGPTGQPGEPGKAGGPGGSRSATASEPNRVLPPGRVRPSGRAGRQGSTQ